MRRHLRNHTNPGSSQRAGGRSGRLQRRRRAKSSNVAAGSTSQRATPSEEVRLIRPTGSSGIIDTDSLTPPISTLTLQDVSSSSSRGSDGELDCDMSAHDDDEEVEEEDELSDDDFQSPLDLANNQNIARAVPGSFVDEFHPGVIIVASSAILLFAS
ncbi:hypothetical protein ONZ45_g19218 [Pleurotus djamor]|nr:hypothetical protein ONZ45_g19218 [Pleurotus djamor]